MDRTTKFLSRLPEALRAFPCLALLALVFPSAPRAQQPTAPEMHSAPSASIQKNAENQSGSIGEEELRHMLVGKTLYLRGGYLDNALSFNEHGGLVGHSPTGSYTLCGVEIEKIHLTKHKLELTAQRYGLHFLGALPTENSSTVFDRVRITPNKKSLKIAIDRERIVKPKKIKEKKARKGAPVQAAASPQGDAEEDKAKTEAEKPADPKSVTTTTSPAHAAQVLREALDKIFAIGLDERMKSAMPAFWQIYYRAAAAKADYRPADPAVLRQNAVDRKARLLTPFEPSSNEFAQAAGVAGMALYHAVIGPDGNPGEIAVARPIGFGLDENAVEAIRNARFEPALKNGQPVPVLLDLVVQFRIFSARTTLKPAPLPADKKVSEQPAPVLPGPYSRQP